MWMRSELRILVIPAVVCAAALAASLAGARVHAQAPAAAAQDSKIWTGIYSSAQAARGKAVYEAYCTRCHGLNLLGGRQGGSGGPALKADGFWLSWERAPVTSILSQIMGTMPRDSPASLRDDDYTDVLAYILSENAFPAGSAELTAASMENVQILRQGGTVSEAPDFSLVQVVGCLTAASGNTWTLTNTTSPLVTRDEKPTPASVADAAARTLGNETIQLLSVAHLSPASHAGHRMEVRGLLNKLPGSSRIDVLSLQMIGTSCGL